MATLEIPSNVKCITSGQVPTTTNLKDGEFAFGKVGGVAKLYGNVNGVIIDFTGDSGGGSKYANTSEIVDNAITLTSTSTLADLVTQILAQKTKVTRSSDYTNLNRILGTPKYTPVFGATFKVINSQTTSYAPEGHYYPDLVIECIGWGSGHYYKQYIGSYLGQDSSFSSAPSLTGWVDLLTEYNPYPVGSVYISTTNYLSPPPVYYFGGTWEQIKDVFLLAAGDTYTAGSTGGSADAVVVRHGGHVRPSDFDASSIAEADWEIAPSSNSYYLNLDKVNAYGDRRTFTKESGNEVGFRTLYKGESGTGKNMPPYLTVYMWKRLA